MAAKRGILLKENLDFFSKLETLTEQNMWSNRFHPSENTFRHTRDHTKLQI